jgi:hypothetical protein
MARIFWPQKQKRCSTNSPSPESIFKLTPLKGTAFNKINWPLQTAEKRKRVPQPLKGRTLQRNLA